MILEGRLSKPFMLTCERVVTSESLTLIIAEASYHTGNFSLKFILNFDQNEKLLLCVSGYSFHYHRIDLISPAKPCLHFQNNASNGKCCRRCQRKKGLSSKQLIQVILITYSHVLNIIEAVSEVGMKNLRSYEMIVSKSDSTMAAQFQKRFFFFVTASEQSD